jgi:ferredoxin
VRFQPSGREIRVVRGTKLLDAARSAGLPIASGCGGDALCGRCGVTVLSGRELPPEDEREARAKCRNRAGAGLRLACRLVVPDDLEVTASYW